MRATSILVLMVLALLAATQAFSGQGTQVPADPQDPEIEAAIRALEREKAAEKALEEQRAAEKALEDQRAAAPEPQAEEAEPYTEKQYSRDLVITERISIGASRPSQG